MKKGFILLIFCFLMMNYGCNAAIFSLGIENVTPTLLSKIVPAKTRQWAIGLITNQSGLDSKGRRNIDILGDCDAQVRYIFVPEHGLSGVLAERDVHDSVDENTHIPVISLYGNGSGKLIESRYFDDLDLIIFDIQDSGMRHYTYISTLLQCMKVTAEHNKPFVVLDRPNPLCGAMQGPLVDSDLFSFISIAPIPLRHGMTIGEIAWYFNKYVLEKPVELHVVTMKEYTRTNGFEDGLRAQLSPNLRSLQSCYGYSFLGLLGEIEPFDVGVGTHIAFQCIALPVSLHVPVDFWNKVQRLLQSHGIKSFLCHHINPKTKKECKGLRLQFARINNLRSFDLFIDLLLLFKQENISLSFSGAFDKAVGTKKVKDVVAGKRSKDSFLSDIMHDLQRFKKQAHTCFLYKPVPRIFY